jgi:prepilin-type processing-associated H-X9-DG protein
MQCTNNLKQLGLAIHNYHTAHNTFPGSAGDVGDQWPSWRFRAGISAMGPLLPYLEQVPVYELIARDTMGLDGVTLYRAWGFWPMPSSSHRPAIMARAQPPYLLCPSSSASPKPVGNYGGGAKTHYLFCYGDSPLWWQYSDVNQNARGIFFGMPDRFPRRPNSRHRTMADVTDGLSNTLAMSERCSPVSERSVLGNQAHLVPNVFFNPALCYTLRDGAHFRSTAILTNDSPALSPSARAEYREAGAYVSFTGGFNTVLPPNAPSCNAQSFSGELGPFPPQSLHPGGVNGLLADGSVRFISENIDSGNTGTATWAAGPSIYGVWGALGSMNGGEPSREF